MYGIDVAEMGGRVDWTAVKQSGKTFAFVRATEGKTIKDKTFAQNWPAMKMVGIIRGAYHYFHPLTSNPAEQAQEFLKTMGKLEPGDLPPVLDVETKDKSASSAQIVIGMKQWLAIVESAIQQQTGKKIKPIIYTYPNFWNEVMLNPPDFANYPLWIAHYGVATPSIPRTWGVGNWLIHQYAGDVDNVAGIQYRSDLNKFHSIQKGSKGSLVKDIQQRLKDLKKTELNPGLVDGDFGDRTKNAVIAFQRAKQLQADGIVGIKTWIALLWA